MGSSLTDGLNPQQQQAVTAGEGPILVLAGPGSGKTRVLTHRIAYLIRERKVHPSAIVAVTFTNKAAGEMRSRVDGLLDGTLKGLTIGTFHAICARLLRREAEFTPQRADFLIYDTDDQLSLIGQAMNEMNVDSKKFRPRQILNAISSAKNELIGPDTYSGQGYPGEVIERVYSRYQELLIASNARDFDDLLMDTAILFRDQPDVLTKYQRFYEYLLVDEFQDTNAAQYVLVRQLAAPQNNVFVVGDEDQAIYAFRGADYRNVAQFRTDFPAATVILLEQNYRSTQSVLDAARAVIDKNTHRTPKALFTDRGLGEPLSVYEAYSDSEEAEYVIKTLEELRREGLSYRDFAVMYRTNAQSRSLEDAFIREGVPYKLVGGVGFYKRREVRDLIAYLRLVNSGDDTVSFNRIINVPKRGIGKKSLEDFHAWAAKSRYRTGQALEALADGEVSALGASVARKFVEFYTLLTEWRALAGTGDLSALMDDIIGRTNFTGYLHDSSDTTDEALERDENVREFRAVLARKQEQGIALIQFLEEMALVADVDSLEVGAEAVTLLTLHAAKGLEYPVVFLTGLEEGLLPHQRSLDEPEQMAEERRLMYVGLTRAMRRVYLTYAFRRLMYGDSTPGVPSRFLADIPAKLTVGTTPRLLDQRDRRSFHEEVRWERGRSANELPAASSRPLLPLTNPNKAAASSSKLRYKSGQRVRHSKFGEGIVITSQVMGSDEEVTVSFSDKQVGIKRLAASFANLTVLDG
jgi:DNA helicase-2/ATP-dependent DNA helicase PcrA